MENAKMSHTTDISNIIEQTFQANSVIGILGITGQAGAGKTSKTASLFQKKAQGQDIKVEILGLDSFFKLSSKDRKTWIEEGFAQNPKEGMRRSDQMHWWDFKQAEESLTKLKKEQGLYLPNTYNRDDAGELTRTIQIPNPQKDQKTLIIFEGVAIAHLASIDQLVFVWAPHDVRLKRLKKRDSHRSSEEAVRRFELTQSFELRYFPEFWGNIHHFVQNKKDGQPPEITKALEHKKALEVK